MHGSVGTVRYAYIYPKNLSLLCAVNLKISAEEILKYQQSTQCCAYAFITARNTPGLSPAADTWKHQLQKQVHHYHSEIRQLQLLDLNYAHIQGKFCGNIALQEMKT